MKGKNISDTRKQTLDGKEQHLETKVCWVCYQVCRLTCFVDFDRKMANSVLPTLQGNFKADASKVKKSICGVRLEEQ